MLRWRKREALSMPSNPSQRRDEPHHFFITRYVNSLPHHFQLVFGDYLAGKLSVNNETFDRSNWNHVCNCETIEESKPQKFFCLTLDK
jgi:hypothetical protein